MLERDSEAGDKFKAHTYINSIGQHAGKHNVKRRPEWGVAEHY